MLRTELLQSFSQFGKAVFVLCFSNRRQATVTRRREKFNNFIRVQEERLNSDTELGYQRHFIKVGKRIRRAAEVSLSEYR